MNTQQSLRIQLLFTARSGHLNRVKFLLDAGAGIESQDYDNNTILHLAAKNGHLDAVQYIFEAGANLEAENINLDTLLILAVENGHLDIVLALLEAGANIKSSNEMYQTPLSIASKNGNLKIVNFLLEAGAKETLEEESSCELTPLHFAAENGHLSVVLALLEAGANTKAEDAEYQTPLDLAEENDYDEIVRAIENHINNPDNSIKTIGKNSPFKEPQNELLDKTVKDTATPEVGENHKKSRPSRRSRLSPTTKKNKILKHFYSPY